MKNIVNELKKVYPHSDFVVFSPDPLIIYHNSEELLEDKQLIKNFINAYKIVYGSKGIEKAAIAYDFAEECEELFCCSEDYQQIFEFSKTIKTVTKFINSVTKYTNPQRLRVTKG